MDMKTLLEALNRKNISKCYISKRVGVKWLTVHRWFRDGVIPHKRNQEKLKRILRKCS